MFELFAPPSCRCTYSAGIAKPVLHPTDHAEIMNHYSIHARIRNDNELQPALLLKADASIAEDNWEGAKLLAIALIQHNSEFAVCPSCLSTGRLKCA